MKQSQILFVNKVQLKVRKYIASGEVALFIACQFALESSYGTSRLALSDDNYCGMKNPLVRPSTSHFRGNSSYKWARYDGIDDCITDYFLCIAYHHPLAFQLDSLKGYICFIKKFYCPETDYIDRIMNIYNHFKSLRDGKK